MSAMVRTEWVDVLAGTAVAAGGGPHQHPVVVADRYGEPVELELDCVGLDLGVLQRRQSLLAGRPDGARQPTVHPLGSRLAARRC